MKRINFIHRQVSAVQVLSLAVVLFFAAQQSAAEEPISNRLNRPVSNQVLMPEEKSDSGLETLESEINFEDGPKKGVTIKPNMPMDGKETTSGLSYSRQPTLSELREPQIIQINDSLRTLIEENEKIKQENEGLDKQVRELRGMVNFETQRSQKVMSQQDNYKKQNDFIIQANQKSQAELEQMKNNVMQQEQSLIAKMDKLTAKEKEVSENVSSPVPVVAATAGNKIPAAGKQKVAAKQAPAKSKNDLQVAKDKEQLLKMIDEMGRETQKMKLAQGKVHYNMGNMFFARGDYEKSAHEYAQAVALMPQDCSAHFNLAFVSSEYIRDYKTALEHYKQYLFLNPTAEDGNLVKEKIVEAELTLKAKIDSTLDDDYYVNNKYNRR